MTDDLIGKEVVIVADAITKGCSAKVIHYSDCSNKWKVSFYNSFIGWYKRHEFVVCDDEVKEDGMQKYNKGHDSELMDRLHTVQEMIAILLTDHPAAVKHGIAGSIDKAAGILSECYQGLGNNIGLEE